MVVIGRLLDHREVVGPLRRERQLRADALDLGAAGALDDHRCLVEVQQRHGPVRVTEVT
jgi:hypothetical protein